MNARTALGGVRFDVRDRVGFGRVEACVRPGGSARQQELQSHGAEPESAHGGGMTARGVPHAGVRSTFRNATAPTKTMPYMHTISGPVGRSPARDSHRPSTDARAPELHEM